MNGQTSIYFFHCWLITTFKFLAARKKVPFIVPYRFPHRNPRLVPRPSKHLCYFSDYSSFILHQREALYTSPLSALVQVLKGLQRRDLFVIGTSLKQSAGNRKCYKSSTLPDMCIILAVTVSGPLRDFYCFVPIWKLKFFFKDVQRCFLFTNNHISIPLIFNFPPAERNNWSYNNDRIRKLWTQSQPGSSFSSSLCGPILWLVLTLRQLDRCRGIWHCALPSNWLLYRFCVTRVQISLYPCIVSSSRDLFSLCVLFSHFRPRDATLGNSCFHTSSYARANVRITYERNVKKRK